MRPPGLAIGAGRNSEEDKRGEAYQRQELLGLYEEDWGFCHGRGEMSMSKTFNVSADCKPELHYMVDIGGRLREIKRMVDRGDYFTINRARQYGKTTTLKALKRYLIKEYIVISLDLLWDYLDYYHLKKGYMLSFNFNKKKELGAREIVLGDKVLVEAVV